MQCERKGGNPWQLTAYKHSATNGVKAKVMARGLVHNRGWSLGAGPLFTAPPNMCPFLKQKAPFAL